MTYYFDDDEEGVNPKPCRVCGESTVQAGRHASCDPNYPLVAMWCICPPGCTTGDVWGDGPRDCVSVGDNPQPCEPCTLMAGKPYVNPKKKKTTAPVDEPVAVPETWDDRFNFDGAA